MWEQSVNKGLLLTAHDGYWNLLYKESTTCMMLKDLSLLTNKCLQNVKASRTKPVLLNTLSYLVFINVT